MKSMAALQTHFISAVDLLSG